MAIFNLAAGHGAADAGAVNGARYEKNDNLRMSLAVGNELIKRGHTVRQFRTDDSKNCSATASREWLGVNSADCSVVFHRNAFSGSANGCETWTFNADAKSCNLGTLVNNAVCAAAGFTNRGRKGNGAAWLNPAVTCIQPEIGFITDAGDNTKFDTKFDTIVLAVCDALEAVFGAGSSVSPSGDKIAVGSVIILNGRLYATAAGAGATGIYTNKEATVTRIIDGAYAGYLLNNGSLGWARLENLALKVTTPAPEIPSPDCPTTAEVERLKEDLSLMTRNYAAAITEAEAVKTLYNALREECRRLAEKYQPK